MFKHYGCARCEVRQSVISLFNCWHDCFEVDVKVVVCVCVCPISWRVSYVSMESAWIAEWMADGEIEIPMCASACMTFSGVFVECRNIPKTLSSALHFALWFCIMILIIMTFFYNNMTSVTIYIKNHRNDVTIVQIASC